MFDADDTSNGHPFLNDDDGLPSEDELDPYAANQILLTAEEAAERGYDSIADRLESKVESYLEPVYKAEQIQTVSYRETQDDLAEPVVDVLATSNIYMEALSSFTEDEGDITQGTDIANGYIQAETHSEAADHLARFEDWLRETVETSMDAVDGPVETPEKSYDPDEFTEIAVETGLQSLIKMRRDDREYPDDGIINP